MDYQTIKKQFPDLVDDDVNLGTAEKVKILSKVKLSKINPAYKTELHEQIVETQIS